MKLELAVLNKLNRSNVPLKNQGVDAFWGMVLALDLTLRDVQKKKAQIENKVIRGKSKGF